MANNMLDLRMGVDARLNASEVSVNESTVGTISYAVDKQNLYIDALIKDGDNKSFEKQMINADKAYVIRDENENIIAKSGYGDYSFQSGFFGESRVKIKLIRAEGYVDATYDFEVINDVDIDINNDYILRYPVYERDGRIKYFKINFINTKRLFINDFSVQFYTPDYNVEYELIDYQSGGAFGDNSHAEGDETIALGNQSHTEGSVTKALGTNSHAEGDFSRANGRNSHAEGRNTEANGDNSHAGGNSTKANGKNSHTEGQNTEANGDNSHAMGLSTISNFNNSTVIGQYNLIKNKYEVVEISQESYTGATNTTYFYIGDKYSFNQEQGYFEISNTLGITTDAWGRITRDQIDEYIQNNEDTSLLFKYMLNSDQKILYENVKVNKSLATINGQMVYTGLDSITFPSTAKSVKTNPHILFAIGNGSSDNNRSDAFIVNLDGNAEIKNNLTIGNDLIVNNSAKIPQITGGLEVYGSLYAQNGLSVYGNFSQSGDSFNTYASSIKLGNITIDSSAYNMVYINSNLGFDIDGQCTFWDTPVDAEGNEFITEDVLQDELGKLITQAWARGAEPPDDTKLFWIRYDGTETYGNGVMYYYVEGEEGTDPLHPGWISMSAIYT